MKVVLDLVYKMNATQKEELKEISPSDLGLEWDMCDAVLDALTDREEEFKRNPNLTNMETNKFFTIEGSLETSLEDYEIRDKLIEAIRTAIGYCDLDISIEEDKE